MKIPCFAAGLLSFLAVGRRLVARVLRVAWITVKTIPPIATISTDLFQIFRSSTPKSKKLHTTINIHQTTTDHISRPSCPQKWHDVLPTAARLFKSSQWFR